MSNLLPTRFAIERKTAKRDKHGFLAVYSRNREMWKGKSPSGLEIEGYYTIPEGAAATAWPVYKGN